MKVYIVESGLWTEMTREIIRIYADEEKALRYCMRRFGIKNMGRDNPAKVKGLRAKWIGRKRWVLITEHDVR